VFNAFAALVNVVGERMPGPGMEPMQRETMTLRDSVSVPEDVLSAMPLSEQTPASPEAPSLSSPLPSPPLTPSSLLPPSPFVPSATEARSKTFPRLLESDEIALAPPPSPSSFSPLSSTTTDDEKVGGEKGASLSLEEDSVAEEEREETPRRKKKRRKNKPSPLALVLDPSEKPTVWQRLHLPAWCRPLFYLISLPGLAALLAAQATFFLHDELASSYPKLTPALSFGCRLLHCEIRPLQNLGVTGLGIEASDLQFDPHDAKQQLLSVTLRNRSDKPVAYPRLALELTDARNQLLARIFFTPEMYLPPSADVRIGAPASSDVSLRLLLRNDVTASGYRVTLVY
jgi:hypothetical protein